MASGNTFGTLLKLTLFGESHGQAVGAVLDGFPAGQDIDHDLIADMLAQRAPSGNGFETTRVEPDDVEFLSGIANDKTLGSPIAFSIRNRMSRSSDYSKIKNAFRPGHADYVYFKKYGIEPQPGGGRASGRETAARVVAGALALGFLQKQNIKIISFVSEIGPVKMAESGEWPDEKAIKSSILRCPDKLIAKNMSDYLDSLTAQKETTGGIITTLVSGLPAGLGEPVFGKLTSTLAQAMLSIPAALGVEFGEGFGGVALTGSEYNDAMMQNADGIAFQSNHSGGIQAGISNGNVLKMKTLFRPPSSIGTKQQTVDVDGKPCEIVVEGRHDACFVPRASVVVTSMAAITLMDMWLQKKSYEWGS